MLSRVQCCVSLVRVVVALHETSRKTRRIAVGIRNFANLIAVLLLSAA